MLLLLVDTVHADDVMDSLGLNVNMSITNIGTQGYPGVGKTSILDLAVGKKPALERHSTGCADPPVRYMLIESKEFAGVKWENVPTAKLFEMLCGAVKKCIEKNAHTKTDGAAHQHQSPTSADSKLHVTASEINRIESVTSDLSSVSHHPITSYPPPPLPPPPSPSPPPATNELFSELLETVRGIESSDVIFNSHWMIVTDSGGQPPFLDAAALFLRNSCLQIFPLKLNELLSKNPEFSYYINGESACFAKSTLPLTNLQVIETLAKAAVAYQPPHTPSAKESPKSAKFTIVGTFYDKADTCEETIEEKESRLEEALKPYKSYQVRYGDDIILPVNAITTDKEERKQLSAKLQQLIIDASDVTMKVTVRLSWFGFLLSMLTISEKQKRPILTLSECLEIGRSLKMDESETMEAIEFFHNIGLIMHFDTTDLRDSVIVYTKPLLKKISLLISLSFLTKKFVAEHYNITFPSREAQEDLQYHGRFSRDTLETCLKFYEPITAKFFINVLEHVKAIAAIGDTPEYIMPCALSYATETEEYRVLQGHQPWIVRLRMRQGTKKVFIPIPVGYLPAMVVFLLTEFKSEFCTIDSDNNRQYRNLISLQYEKGGIVYIVERHLDLEVYFTFCEIFPQECAIIRDRVLKSISLTEKRLQIQQHAITKVDCFLCSCADDSSRHICVYNRYSKIAEHVNGDRYCNLEHHQLVWISGMNIMLVCVNIIHL